MSPARRHECLIPLSREHHYALVVCLHIRQELGREHPDPFSLRSRAETTVRFFHGDLKIHFDTEEKVLFPVMQGMPRAADLVREMYAEHQEIENLAMALRRLGSEHLATSLARFAELLETHIRKEERSLFPIFEQHALPKVAEQGAWEIEERIGLALQPRHPELLK